MKSPTDQCVVIRKSDGKVMFTSTRESCAYHISTCYRHRNHHNYEIVDVKRCPQCGELGVTLHHSQECQEVFFMSMSEGGQD